MTPTVRWPRSPPWPLRPQTKTLSPLAEVGALHRLGGEGVAGGVVRRADVAEALGGVLLLAVGQRGVERGEDDALLVGLIDHRAGGGLAGEAVGGDAVDLGRHRLLDLGQHLVRIPVREIVGDRRSEILRGLEEAVVDVVGEDAALRPAGEGGDLHAFAPLGRRVEREGGAGRQGQGERRRCVPRRARSRIMVSSSVSRAAPAGGAPRSGVRAWLGGSDMSVKIAGDAAGGCGPPRAPHPFA